MNFPEFFDKVRETACYGVNGKERQSGIVRPVCTEGSIDLQFDTKDLSGVGHEIEVWPALTDARTLQFDVVKLSGLFSSIQTITVSFTSHSECPLLRIVGFIGGEYVVLKIYPLLSGEKND